MKALVFVLNHISCAQLFENPIGLALIRYYDFHYVLAIFVALFLNFFFLSAGGIYLVFKFMIGFDFFGLFLMFFFYRKIKDFENKTQGTLINH